MRAISLGAGVQSSALLLLALEGRVEADCAVFADTQSEPKAVYKHLKLLQERCETAGFPLHVVTVGNLGTEIKAGGYAAIPAFTAHGMGRRQCTYQFKLRPIRRKIKELTTDRPVTMLMGISLDEYQRMRDSGLKWIRNEYPLVDMRWSRYDCFRYLYSLGVDAPRSACTFCPFRTNAEWRSLTAAEFEDAVTVDEALRTNGRTPAYLHASRIPLREVDLSTAEDHGQLSWLGECEGMCGV